MAVAVNGWRRARLPAVFLTVWCAGLCGCGGHGPLVRMDPRDQIEISRRDFERGKFLKVIPALQDLTLNYPGTPEGAEAQLLLGECYRRTKQYDLARDAYEDLVRDYPDSKYRDEAQLKVGVCYFEESLPPEYDQELTQRATEEFEVFLSEYPDSPLHADAEQWLAKCKEKIARKEYLNGRLYLKMGYASAARRVFQRVLDDYPESDLAAPATLGIARSYLQEKNRAEARAVFNRLMEEYPGTPEARIARQAIGQLGGSPEGQS